MQKRKQRTEATNENRTARKHTAVSLPEVVDIDVLSTMRDEDLITRLRALDEDRTRAYEQGRDVRPWEVEIAYIRREQQIRRTQRTLHEEITRKAQEEFDRTEASLPSADLDNSAFVFAAFGGRARWN